MDGATKGTAQGENEELLTEEKGRIQSRRRN